METTNCLPVLTLKESGNWERNGSLRHAGVDRIYNAGQYVRNPFFDSGDDSSEELIFEDDFVVVFKMGSRTVVKRFCSHADIERYFKAIGFEVSFRQ